MHNIKLKQYAKKHEGMDTIRLSHISACKWCGNGFSEFLLQRRCVKDSVLWYVSQTLVYAGSIFGVGIYIQSKWGDVRNYIDRVVNSKNGKEEE